MRRSCELWPFEVEVAGERFVAEATLRPFYDPTNARVRDVENDAGSAAAASWKI